MENDLSDDVIKRTCDGMDAMNLSSTCKTLKTTYATERADMKRVHGCFRLRDNLQECMQTAKRSAFKQQRDFGLCNSYLGVEVLEIRLSQSFLAENQCKFLLAVQRAARQEVIVTIDRRILDNRMDGAFADCVGILPTIHTLRLLAHPLGNVPRITPLSANIRSYEVGPFSIDANNTGIPCTFCYSFDQLESVQLQQELSERFRNKKLDVVFVLDRTREGDDHQYMNDGFICNLQTSATEVTYRWHYDAGDINQISRRDQYNGHNLVTTWWDLTMNMDGHDERNGQIEGSDENGANALIVADNAELAVVVGLGPLTIDGVRMRFQTLPLSDSALFHFNVIEEGIP